MLTGNFGFRLKYKSKTLLEALIQKYGGCGIYGIKGPRSQPGRHALIIYTAEALSKHLSNTLSSFPSMSSHSGFRESIELMNAVLDLGYTVDYFSFKEAPDIAWSKYQLVIDSANYLEGAPAVPGQKRIFYATSCHWRLFYENAYRHTDSFYRRNGLLLYPDRELKTNYSDEAADLITCFGGSYQAASFGPNSHKVRHLNISTTCLPATDFKKVIASKTKFMWYAGYGVFHKGLDLVVEAFMQLPDMELHVFGHIEANTKLYSWFLEKKASVSNITYHGWATPDSETFRTHAQLCDAVVFTSSSEGGAGAIIQCMQFGLIPIINKSTAIDLPENPFNITGNDPEEEIASMIQKVKQFAGTDTTQLQRYSDELAEHYCRNNTIASYISSIKTAIASLA